MPSSISPALSRWRGGAPAVVMALLVHAVLPFTASAQAATALLGVEGRNNDAVSVAAQGAFVATVWGASTAGGMDVFSAVSRDGGRRFSAPVRVNRVAFEARVGGEQPPHLVLIPRAGADPSIVVVWTAKGSAGGRLLSARSDDGGASFGASATVPGSDAPGSRGWASVAADVNGRVSVLWLDHRNTVSATAQPPASRPDPVAQAAKSQLYIASLDGRIAPRALTGGVCYCCKTALAATGYGRIIGAWRHVFPGNLRDIAMTVSRDRGASFTPILRVSEDQWAFDGCPDNGPSLAIDGRTVHVVWPTPEDGKNPSVMALFHATSSDGAAFSPRTRIPTSGPAGHVQVLALGGGTVLLVAWEEMAAGVRVVKLARGIRERNGSLVFAAVGAPQPGKYPSLAVGRNGVVMAWTQPREGGGNVIAVSQFGR